MVECKRFATSNLNKVRTLDPLYITLTDEIPHKMGTIRSPLEVHLVSEFTLPSATELKVVITSERNRINHLVTHL